MNQQQAQAIILFDGVCLLCQASVRFILKHDTKKQFLFAPLQGRMATIYLSKPSSDKGFDTMLLIENEKVYTRSTAALLIAKRLRFPINLCYIFIVIPRFIRDAVYDYISRKRYHWFGQSESCMMPTQDIARRFLD